MDAPTACAPSVECPRRSWKALQPEAPRPSLPIQTLVGAQPEPLFTTDKGPSGR